MKFNLLILQIKLQRPKESKSSSKGHFVDMGQNMGDRFLSACCLYARLPTLGDTV